MIDCICRSISDRPKTEEGGNKMENMELGEIQLRFAELVWERQPIASGELVKLCAKEFNWKKSTTYTVLHKMCDKGIMQNIDGTVTALISRQDYFSGKSEQFVKETFGGSLPAFIAAFTQNKKLSADEAAEIMKLIDSYLSEE